MRGGDDSAKMAVEFERVPIMTTLTDKLPPKRHAARRSVIGAAALLTAVMGWASVSWACAFWNYPTIATSPNRAVAASDVTVSGTGWQPELAVSLELSTDGNSVLQPLGSVATDADGKFTARVRLGDAAAGVYYVSASQGTSRANIPLEVTAFGKAIAGAGWTLPDSKAPSLRDVSRSPSGGSSFPWAVVLVAGLLSVGGAAATFEIRRQRASA